MPYCIKFHVGLSLCLPFIPMDFVLHSCFYLGRHFGVWACEEKEKAFSYAKFIADRFDLSKNEGRKLNLAQEMYAYAMPRQYT